MKNQEARETLKDILKSDYILNDNELQNAEIIEEIISSGEPLPDSEALFLIHLHAKALKA